MNTMRTIAKIFPLIVFKGLPTTLQSNNANFKNIFLLLVLLINYSVTAQVNVTVNVADNLKTLNGWESGINVNYLMDDAILNPTPAINTTNALKQMGVKFLRYPGGEVSDNYLFAASPWLSSSPRMALNDAACYWPTNDPTFVNTNDPEKTCKESVLDFDEFMVMCNNIGAQPLIVVAYDAIYNTTRCVKPTKAELITHASEWVRYANITKGYNVKYWMIGNESWNSPTYNGQTTPAQYAIDINDFASAMRAVDPTIKIIANGKNGWWQTLLQSSAAGNIDFLGYSEYPTYNYIGGYDYYRLNDVNLTTETDAAISDIANFATPTDKARIKVIPTEFNSIDYSGNWNNENNLGHALANFQMFGDLITKPKVETAFMWNTRWVTNASSPQNIYDALDANGNLNATGLAQQLWSKIISGNLVSTTSNSNNVKVFACYNNPSKKLNIALLNKENANSNINLSINNFVSSFTGSRSELKGTSAGDKFPTYTETATISGLPDISSITIPANSITILEMQDITVLPIQLISFTGTARQQGNILEWKITGASGVTNYEIERSEDGIQFKHVAIINAIRDPALRTYSFTDNDIINKKLIYYRLKINNTDGSHTYSSIINLKVLQRSSIEVEVFPNPVQSNISFEIAAAEKHTVMVHILQMDGKIIYKQRIFFNAGKSFFQLPGNVLKQPGIYMLEMNDGKNKIISRFTNYHSQ